MDNRNGEYFNNERDVVEAKRRLLLRQNDPDLRELESKLRLAYVNKARAAQIAEKELQRSLRRSEEEEDLKNQRERLEEELREEEKTLSVKEYVKQREFKRGLDLQIEEKNEVNRLRLEDFFSEKKKIDEIVARIRKEEEEKSLQRLIKRKVERELIDAFVETQKERAREEEARCEEQNVSIQRYLAQREEIEKKRELAEKEKRRLKNENVLKLAEEIQERQKEAREREELLRELMEGRKRDEDKLSEWLEAENAMRRKYEIRRCNEAAMEVRQREVEARRREEEEYRRAWIENMEKEAKLEQMNDQKRRMKRLQLHKEAEKHMEQRRLAKLRRKEEEDSFVRSLMAEEEERRRKVEEERLQLLRDNASKLLGFLPPGVLKESDFNYLPSEIWKSYFDGRKIHSDPLQKLEEFYKIN